MLKIRLKFSINQFNSNTIRHLLFLTVSTLLLASCGNDSEQSGDPADRANWSDWSAWTPTVTIPTQEKLVQTRSRECVYTINGETDNPLPMCDGVATESQTVDNPAYTRVECSTLPHGATFKVDSHTQTFTKRSRDQITAENAESTCTSGITDMSGLFFNMTTFNADISHWDTSNVTNMSDMFSNAEAFNQNITGWDTSKVTNFSGMFADAVAFNQNISYWDTSSATNMQRMFSFTDNFNQNIGSWDTSKVTDMSYMFNEAATFNGDITKWNTSNVTNMSYLFYRANDFNQDIGDWNTSNVANMSYMFFRADSFNHDIGNWDTSKVTTMQAMFQNADAFNKDISDWMTIEVINMASMFQGASAFNRDIGSWDTDKVTDMTAMFQFATAFNQDLSDWCVSQISSTPTNFADNSGLTSENMPIWGQNCNANKLFVTAGNVLPIEPIVEMQGDICFKQNFVQWYIPNQNNTTPINFDNWQHLISNTNQLQACGHQDWQIPTATELMQLLNEVNQSEYLQQLLNHIDADMYWSKTSLNQIQAVVVNFKNSELTPAFKHRYHYPIFVR